ncbi:MAG: hypothetical protein LH650_10290, partial [Chloroflexi bacterium]|nr:hypothetical protein [Chloroflexota bacterium]
MPKDARSMHVGLVSMPLTPSRPRYAAGTRVDQDEVTDIVRQWLDRNADRLGREEAIEQALMPAEIPTAKVIRQLQRRAAARRDLQERYGLLSSQELAQLRHARTTNASTQT